ncbi:unnamed protein product [Sphagnum jensenii]|uniref:Uncharacterized protein n=1 Tax=Sphagnum jensenii TaxID=128206 RepID=A0ABP1C1W9_9BRYO
MHAQIASRDDNCTWIRQFQHSVYNHLRDIHLPTIELKKAYVKGNLSVPEWRIIDRFSISSLPRSSTPSLKFGMLELCYRIQGPRGVVSQMQFDGAHRQGEHAKGRREDKHGRTRLAPLKSRGLAHTYTHS